MSNSNRKILFQFFCILILGLIPGFVIQNTFTKDNLDLNLIFTYSFNILFTIPFVILITFFLEKLKRQIGFIFLGLGFLKVILFLGYTKLNEIDINRQNFLIFFVPYFLCIFAEVFILSKYLNKAEF